MINRSRQNESYFCTEAEQSKKKIVTPLPQGIYYNVHDNDTELTIKRKRYLFVFRIRTFDSPDEFSSEMIERLGTSRKVHGPSVAWKKQFFVSINIVKRILVNE